MREIAPLSSTAITASLMLSVMILSSSARRLLSLWAATILFASSSAYFTEVSPDSMSTTGKPLSRASE